MSYSMRPKSVRILPVLYHCLPHAVIRWGCTIGPLFRTTWCRILALPPQNSSNRLVEKRARRRGSVDIHAAIKLKTAEGRKLNYSVYECLCVVHTDRAVEWMDHCIVHRGCVCWKWRDFVWVRLACTVSFKCINAATCAG